MKIYPNNMQHDAACSMRTLADLHHQKYAADVTWLARTSPGIPSETSPVPKPHTYPSPHHKRVEKQAPSHLCSVGVVKKDGVET